MGHFLEKLSHIDFRKSVRYYENKSFWITELHTIFKLSVTNMFIYLILVTHTMVLVWFNICNEGMWVIYHISEVQQIIHVKVNIDMIFWTLIHLFNSDFFFFLQMIFVICSNQFLSWCTTLFVTAPKTL